jgi:hypothetical protein
MATMQANIDATNARIDALVSGFPFLVKRAVQDIKRSEPVGDAAANDRLFKELVLLGDGIYTLEQRLTSEGSSEHLPNIDEIAEASEAQAQEENILQQIAYSSMRSTEYFETDADILSAGLLAESLDSKAKGEILPKASVQPRIVAEEDNDVGVFLDNTEDSDDRDRDKTAINVHNTSDSSNRVSERTGVGANFGDRCHPAAVTNYQVARGVASLHGDIGGGLEDADDRNKGKGVELWTQVQKSSSYSMESINQDPVSVGLGKLLMSDKYGPDALLVFTVSYAKALVFQTVGHVTHVGVTRYVYDPGGSSLYETGWSCLVPL